ncbi:MAG: glycosyltransferase family 2 protein [Campylobacterales bacterium]|nr:glycosyltransferase family 2 protein [Campylobacterales bacterium]
MSEKPFFSVVIATYNRAWCIKRAVNSVLNQTYQDFEIVIVDDGSSDNTEEIINEYQNSKIRYFKFDKNQGQMPAKNYGIEKSIGAWIVILDSDNEIVIDCLEIFKEEIEKEPNIYMFAGHAIDSQTNKSKINSYWYNIFKKEPTANFNQLICDIGFGELFHVTHCSIFNQVSFLTKSKRNTQIIWYKTYRFTNIKFIDKNLSLYHSDGDDSITNNKFKNASLWVDGVKEFIDEFQDDIIQRCPKHMSFHYKSLGIYQYFAGQKSEARKTFIRALEYNPFDYKVWIYLISSFNQRLFEKIANR